MRRLAILLLLPLLLGATRTVNIPNDVVFVTKAREMCEIIRVREGIRDCPDPCTGTDPVSGGPAFWGDKECIEFFFHREVISEIRKDIQRGVAFQARQDAADAVADFEARFPFYVAVAGRPDPPVRMSCGDGFVDNDASAGHVEACDGGAETAACNSNCTLSVCGDGIQNVTDGEQCDDGNTDPGDGCNATCQTE